jgi:hypothetical protein
MPPELFAAFGKIAKYLRHPLVLTGFAVFLFYQMVNKLMETGILPKLTQDTGGQVVMLFLQYGFWLAALLVVLGFGLQFFKVHSDSDVKKRPD